MASYNFIYVETRCLPKKYNPLAHSLTGTGEHPLSKLSIGGRSHDDKSKFPQAIGLPCFPRHQNLLCCLILIQLNLPPFFKAGFLQRSSVYAEIRALGRRIISITRA